jgi:hypothetical protein
MSELIDNLAKILATEPLRTRRLRLAVSPEEYEEIRKYMLVTYGEFYARIMHVPLIVESDPENPTLVIEEKR